MKIPILRTSLAVGGFVLGVCLPVAAQEPQEKPKEPWLWTEEERLEARYDPELARARNLRAQEEWDLEPFEKRAGVSALEDQIRVDGQWNPELFLPWEIFNYLIQWGFLSEEETRHQRRAEWIERVPHLPLKEDFWSRLETVISPYTRLQQAFQGQEDGAENRELGKVLSPKDELDPATRSALLCEARADVLEAAYKEFGKALFDRFLYEAVAVNIGMGHTRDRDAWMVAYVARGCR